MFSDLVFYSYRAVSAAEGRTSLTQDMIRTIGLAMSFLTLCCRTSPRLCCGVSVSALLSTVAIYASRMDTSYLSCHLLTLLSSLGSSRGHIPKSLNIGFDKIPWEIALSRPRSDILLACKIAHINEISRSRTYECFSMSRILCTVSRTTSKPSHIYCYRDLGLLEKCPALNSHWTLHRG
jgi:hypothetical protein